MMKKITLNGPLISDNNKEVYDYYGMVSISAKGLKEQLPEDNSDIELSVNSNGGLVTVGSEIYTLLKSYPGKVTVIVTGMAASAASVAIMGADKIVISPTAQIMIHKASFRWVSGNSDELDKASNALKASDQAIVNAYVTKTGLPEDDIMALMRNETYMSAHEAVEKGFADEVMTFDIVNELNSGMLPKAVIDNYFERCSEIRTMKLELEKADILKDL